jgi:hypothetical protein
VTSAHFIFIPAVAAIGMFLGFMLGTRVAQDRVNLELKRQAEREEARRQRAERKAGKATAAPGGDAAAIPITEAAETVKAKKSPPSR